MGSPNSFLFSGELDGLFRFFGSEFVRSMLVLRAFFRGLVSEVFLISLLGIFSSLLIFVSKEKLSIIGISS
jgi:hypothetical protein